MDNENTILRNVIAEMKRESDSDDLPMQLAGIPTIYADVRRWAKQLAALSAPAQQAVTDEMVERALDYFYDNSPFNGPDELKEGLRATLLAALAQPQAAQEPSNG